MTFPLESTGRDNAVGPLRFRSHGRLGREIQAAEAEEDLTAEVERLRAALFQAEQQRIAEVSLAREQGAKQTRAVMEEEAEEQRAELRREISDAVDAFEADRKRYFADAEAEVVKLALALARRILNREAKLDPLMLRGVVRVAVEQMTSEDEVRLRVPRADVAAWTEILQGQDVQVEGDAGLQPGGCELYTKCGSVDLGVEAQLSEIETSFCELLGKRPS
ncbi:FliH/SctL family protein [Terriglobus albidus]|uniref:FliH/SctL family protein n=1 Tax=Terriglobus albidus TaxID=1592106 RepID=UPI0021E0492B|nr:FliH/SctL family protein [Terriglobus albidus]